jgi:hypothetical protein
VIGRAWAQGLTYNAIITQLSQVGALVESTTKILSGTNVVLAFSIPGQDTPLTIHGTVLTSGAPETKSDESPSETCTWHVEIQFTDLSSTDLARIKIWALHTMPPSPSRS